MRPVLSLSCNYAFAGKYLFMRTSVQMLLRVSLLNTDDFSFSVSRCVSVHLLKTHIFTIQFSHPLKQLSTTLIHTTQLLFTLHNKLFNTYQNYHYLNTLYSIFLSKHLYTITQSQPFLHTIILLITYTNILQQYQLINTNFTTIY